MSRWLDTFTPFGTFHGIAVRNAYKQFYAPAMRRRHGPDRYQAAM
jgi:hypothetical protein